MVVYSNEIIGFINVFENATRASVKDCFIDEDVLVFVVMPGNLGKALGKGASNIKQLGFMFKKRLRIIEFNDDPVKFVSNLIYPIRAREIVLENDSVVIRTDNVRDKGQVFGRERSNLKKIQMLVSKYFPLAVKIE
ncbi:MAG: NusA-like transcription termination signal-binding factor [Candidatus Woesearchaeota archaeon]